MLTLQEVCESTSAIFEHFDLQGVGKLPEPPVLYKDRLVALEEAKLTSQRDALIFDLRCWQAVQLGFKRIESNEIVKMLMGEQHTHTGEGPERQNHEWVYNHHTDEVTSPSVWGGVPARWTRIERKGLWYLPPFKKVKLWEVQLGKLDYLKREIPYGVVLRINECKSLKLFNVFNVMAPMEAWERKTDIDPIVVGSIWEMPADKEDKYNSAGQVAHFFLAQWDSGKPQG